MFEINSEEDINKLIKAVITDRTATLHRDDGMSVNIVKNGNVLTEVYNQKPLLVDWCNLRVKEFPLGGVYTKAGI